MFTHDCQKCSYLGSRPVGTDPVDWYWCPGARGGSVVGRYGNEGAEYWSLPAHLLSDCMGDSYADIARTMLTLQTLTDPLMQEGK